MSKKNDNDDDKKPKINPNGGFQAVQKITGSDRNQGIAKSGDSDKDSGKGSAEDSGKGSVGDSGKDSGGGSGGEGSTEKKKTISLAEAAENSDREAPPMETEDKEKEEVEEPSKVEIPEVAEETTLCPSAKPKSSIDVDGLIKSALSKVSNFTTYVLGNIFKTGSSSSSTGATENTFNTESPFSFSGTTGGTYSSVSPLVESLLSGNSQTSYKTSLGDSAPFTTSPYPNFFTIPTIAS